MGWKWEKFAEYLPARVLQQIDSYELTDDEEAIDKVFWCGSNSGKFTIKSALKIIRGELDMGATEHWKFMWKIPIPQKVRFFVWLVMHNRLLSNANRFI